MRRNNFLPFNPCGYDDQLSPFGRKVLRTLIQQWNIERDRNNNNALTHHQHQQRRRRYKCNRAQQRVITFGEDNSSTPKVTQTRTHRVDNYNFEDVNAESPFEFPSVELSTVAGARFPAPVPMLPPELSPRPVPTSTELMAIPAFPSSLRAPVLQHDFARSDLITSVDAVNFRREQNFNSFQYKDFLSNDSVGKEAAPGLTVDVINNGEIHTFNKSKDAERTVATDIIVNWDNMFDTELFSDADTTPDQLLTKQDHNQKIFQINFPGENPHSEDKHRTKPPRKEKGTVNLKKAANKRKIQMQVTEAFPKKVKRVVEKKPKRKTQRNHSLRSSDYSHTVTNWLNDVDPNNPVEDSSAPGNNRDGVQQTNNNIRKLEIMIEEAPNNKPTKNVIQTQLANKGGVMKFGKPKNGDTSIKEATGTSAAEVIGTTAEEKDKPKEKYKPKEKKSKPKFVAPIKSQTSVTEVNYDVLELTDSLVAKCQLDGTKKQEVVMVLLYRNGFCQLNEQHTEGLCLPAGLLLHIHDELNFYLDGNEKHLHQVVQKVLRCNTLVCYDGKAILNFLANKFGLEFDTSLDIVDTKIAGALLDADSPPESFSQLQRSCGAASQRAVAGACARSNAAGYATRLRAAAAALRGRLRQDQLWDLFVDIEMKLVPIVADMERRGVRVDVALLKSMGATLEARMAAVAEACGAAAGRPLQLHSPLQLRTLLYEELKLHTAAGLAVRATGATGAKSVDETMLRSLAAAAVHPLPGLILEYRQLHKAHATFVAGVLNHVRDSVVKPVWEQSAAATGRLASSAPNLQAVPKTPLLLQPGGTGDGATADHSQQEVVSLPLQLQLRSAYVCAAGCALLAADWRHVECRVFAHAASDVAMQCALRAPDLFARLAADWLKKPEAEVTEAERERTKRIVYASMYGAGPRKLMHILCVDYPTALSIAGSFERQFPSVRAFGRAVAARCRAAGGRVTSLCGRVRRLPDVLCDDPTKRAHAERQALNFVIQGSAADMCKLAMVRAVCALRAGGAGAGGGSGGLRARLLLTVHDELVWEVHEDDLAQAAEVIRGAMEQCGARAGLPRLPAALRVGRSWGQLQPYPPPPPPPTRTHLEAATAAIL